MTITPEELRTWREEAAEDERSPTSKLDMRLRIMALIEALEAEQRLRKEAEKDLRNTVDAHDELEKLLEAERALADELAEFVEPRWPWHPAARKALEHYRAAREGK